MKIFDFSSSLLAELVSVKELSNIETVRKGEFRCHRLSVISCEIIRNDILDPISSFYLRNSHCLKENEKIHSLPSIKLRPFINQDKQINTLLQLSTCHSIIRDLTSVSNSFNHKKIHQLIDLLIE